MVRQHNRIAQKAQTSDAGFDELNILSPDTDLEGFNMAIDELGLDLSSILMTS